MKRIAVVGVPGGWSSELLADTVGEKTGFRLLVDPADMVLDLATGRVMCAGYDLTEMDAVMVKKAGPAYSADLMDRLEILRLVARSGVPMFSDPERIMRMIDRLSCTVTLRLGGIPMPETVITESVDHASQAVARFGRAVFKPLYTSKARGMVVIEHGDVARDEIMSFQNNGNPVMYIQRMVEHMGKDLGVAFLGGEYLATYARAGSEKSWNTTTRSGGMYQAYDPPKEIIDLSRKAQDLFGLDFTCVDVVETPDGPKVFEVSAFGGFRGLLVANGIKVNELFVDHVLARIGA
jgi:ribosomal protein S6--L-glutamate ligase